MKTVSGIVFDIQRGGIHDGPGIRTVVFLKGCPLRCIWCHNPESISADIEPDLKTPGKVFGRRMTVDEVMAVVEKDRAYYEPDGGVTFSGGEPMFQFEFTKALLMAAKARGIHTCLDTSGFAAAGQLLEVLPLTDVFHYDYKATDPQNHLLWTGAPLEPILSNLRKIYERGANIILRCPLVPGVNDDETHLRGIAALAAGMPKLEINILPYHSMARDKWSRCGRENPLPGVADPSAEIKNGWRETLTALGVPPRRFSIS